MTAEQQFWLAVVDKVMLGAIALGFGYYVNRALERHKGRETVRAELTRMRLTHLSAMWADLSQLDEQLTRFADRLWDAHLARRQANDLYGTDLMLARRAGRDVAEQWDGSEDDQLRYEIGAAEHRTRRETYWLGPDERTDAVEFVQLIANTRKRLLSGECLILDEPYKRVGMNSTFAHAHPTVWGAMGALDQT